MSEAINQAADAVATTVNPPMHGFVFNLDPVILDLGPVQIRYYGVIFAITLLIAFGFWCWQMKRGGYSKKITDDFLIYGICGTIIGARLGHCIFYEWDIYSKDLLSILYVWQGGLASHGATIGLLLALYLYSLRHKFSYLEIVDRFSFSAAIGATGIRLANFLNSEIVGRETDLPWAVRFMQHDGGAVARHPSQLYEVVIGLTVLATLIIVDKLSGKEKRPVGLLTGVFLGLYFMLRFLVEFTKEYQTTLQQSHGLTMGQYLSIIPFAIGAILIIRGYVQYNKNGKGKLNEGTNV